MRSRVKRLRWIAFALLTAIVFSAMGSHTGSVDLSRQRSLFAWDSFPFAQPAQAQPERLRRINPTALAAQIYEQLPDFPLENQYISSETGEAATDNTLVSRIIRYHLYIQDRPTNFRLDWKLTLADYLGAFEPMSADNYADYGLRENPMENDMTAVQGLSREQRDYFVNALYETFTVPAESDSRP